MNGTLAESTSPETGIDFINVMQQYSPRLFGALAVSLLLALLKEPLLLMLQRRGKNASGLRHTRSTIKATSLLRPVGEYTRSVHDASLTRNRSSVVMSPTEIRAIGRVPLENNLGVSRLLNLMIWIRLFRLRPSSPKPAFVITNWHVAHGSDMDTVAGQFTPGGYRLTVTLHHSESPRHFVRSMRPGFRSRPRTLVICTPEDYIWQEGAFRCLTVRSPTVSLRRRKYHNITLKSTDPLVSGVPNSDLRLASDIPRNSIWLFVGEGHVADPLVDEQVEQQSRIPLELWSTRMRRYVMYMLLLVIMIAIAILITEQLLSLGSDLESDDLPWFVELEMIALSVVTYGIIVMALWDIWYWIFEWRESWSRKAMERAGSACPCEPRPRRFTRRAWIASTTRCMADGDRVRNGASKTPA